jgi:hypothetical protein
MCMQCMAGAMTAVGSASGIRAWVANRHFAWLTPSRLRAVTIVLFAAAMIASATLVSGSAAPPHH